MRKDRSAALFYVNLAADHKIFHTFIRAFTTFKGLAALGEL